MSKIEVNTVAPQCGTTLTLGESGDTVTLGTGASQSGFGRTGTVNWQTTVKTGDFTAVNGKGYFINTTSGAVDMTMPSGSAGAIVAIQDYNKTFDTNALTVTPASGEKINGGSADGLLLINTEGQGLTFVYVDSTVGWKTVHENEFTAGGSSEIIATGGTITTCGDFKIHKFTGPGTFAVSSISTTPANNALAYLVVAGGASAGNCLAGGGGGGGTREGRNNPITPYTASPLAAACSALTATVTSYPITVGAGGAAINSPTQAKGNPGSNSIFSTITSAGGGGGGTGGTPAPGPTGGSGLSGGSGGGVSGQQNDTVTTGAGNTPPVSPPQGNPGGPSANQGPGTRSGSGGGGATAAGSCGGSPQVGGAGGAGATTNISGSPLGYGGGGGGGAQSTSGTDGGASPCGSGGAADVDSNGNAGATNRGGGGGSGSAAGPLASYTSGAGGSGIVVIRYKYQ